MVGRAESRRPTGRLIQRHRLARAALERQVHRRHLRCPLLDEQQGPPVERLDHDAVGEFFGFDPRQQFLDPQIVWADVIGSREVPVVRLTEIFRQAGQSWIVRAAHHVNQGLLPESAPAGQGDFYVVEWLDFGRPRKFKHVKAA